jgi:septation ring formation regulator EzrA
MHEKHKIQKAFENIPSQESVNCTDLLHRINQEVQELKRKVSDLSLENRRLKAMFSQEDSAIRTAFCNFQEMVGKSVKSYSQSTGDNTTRINDLEKHFTAQINAIYSNYVHRIDHDFIQDKTGSSLDHIGKYLEVISKDLNKKTLELKLLFQEEIDNINKKINEEPIKKDPEIEIINEKLCSLRVNFLGNIREIETCKKKADYSQKQFEYLNNILKKHIGE